MAYLDLDISYEITATQLCEYLEKHNLTLKCHAAKGPAGGNPYVQFIGTRADLEQFANEFPDVDFLISLIQD